MTIDIDTVRRIAELAQIREPDSRLPVLADELSRIMAWIEQLNEVDTTTATPMTSPVALAMPMREDHVTDEGDASAVLANAPKSRGGFYVVPKVVE